MKYIIVFFLFLSPACYADSLYVAYRWAKPGNTTFTDSWCIIQTNYDTNIPAGMESLSVDLAKKRGTKAVVITYVRVLHDGGNSIKKERGSDLIYL